ncbi:hypothetical protein [Dyella acidiphila]|uniref:PH domain-containing protein n=1 Tax=Dyella acidiphila TaxID=2775866 RepID=A0ABR9G7B1_9GAMM|nr:hypothetical protein [Dyella acidiphila]MBE1159921.1 hypothetical protein [Dyella acidiphila]
MVQGDGSKLIFQYRRDQLTPFFYMPFIGVLSIALLHLTAPDRYNFAKHPYFYGFWLVAVTLFALVNYLYMRSYRIAMGEQGLVVSSLWGSKTMFYMRLRHVELEPRNRGGKNYRLAILGADGSPVVKIFGDKIDMERITEVLKTRIKPFGL